MSPSRTSVNLRRLTISNRAVRTQMEITGTTMKQLLLSCLLTLAFAQIGHTAEKAIVKSEFIFQQAPFPQCHAATIAESQGTLIAAWFGGKHERNPDVDIWLSRLVKGRWTKPVEVVNGVQSPTKRYPCWNPVLFAPAKGPDMMTTGTSSSRHFS